MVSKTGAYNWYICLVAAGCMVLMGYDASVFNSVQNSNNWAKYFDNPNSYMLGLLNTVYTVGGIITGWFFAGPLAEFTADWLGRRWGMGIGCFLTIIATFMQCFAPRHGMGTFMAGRVIIGAGQALAIAAGPIYVSEVTPSYIRGVVMAFWQMFYSVGSFVAYWVNYAAGKHRGSLGEWDWKLVVIFQLLLPVIILAQLPFMPESPRWLVQRKGDTEAARKVLQRVRETAEEIDQELLTIREAIQYEKETLDHGKKAYMTLIKDASVRKRLFLVFVLNIGQQLSGQGTLNSYSSTIYKKIWTSTDTINLINALNATFGILFTLNATWTVDRFGRRFLLIFGAIGMGTCMFITAMVGLETPNTPQGAKTQPVGIAIVFLMFLFIFFYKPSWGATVWIYTAEVFPMNVRAQAVGMSSQMQGVANTIFQQFFPIFYKNEGLKTFFFFMICNFFLAVFVWFMIPETKKVPLEEMDALFGGVSHVQGGAMILDVKSTEEVEHAEQVERAEQVEQVPTKQ